MRGKCWLVLLLAVMPPSFGDDSARNVGIDPDALRRQAGFEVAEGSGLFVGVRKFEDPVLAEVPYAVDDAVDLAHLFAIELALISPGKVVLALSGEAQKPESQARLLD